jgi:hypothetical protein
MGHLARLTLGVGAFARGVSSLNRFVHGRALQDPAAEGSVKRLVASLAVGGSLLGVGIAIPLTLMAQSAYAAPANSHSHADPDPNLPLKAREALIRNGSWDRVCHRRIVHDLYHPNRALICV